MLNLIARLLDPLLRLAVPATGRRRRGARDGYEPPPAECGPAPHRFGERPLRGEDHPLVRPYVVAHERREQERRRRARRRTLLITRQSVRIPPHPHPTRHLGLTA